MGKLFEKTCKAATRDKDGGKLFDGRGLFLELHKNGGKYWRYKYRSPATKKEKLLSLGVYPEIGLAEARELHSIAHKQVAQGIDPMDYKRELEQQRVQEARNTFRVMALEWYEHKRPEWSDANTKTIKSRLERDIFPIIGNTPIKDITHPMLLDMANDIRKRGANELAKRVIQMCKHILQYAVITGHIERNVAADLSGIIKAKPKGHYAAIDAKELPEFIKVFRSNQARLHRQTYLAVEFMMLTFVRTGEMIAAEWKEFDFKEKMWIVPAPRMKMKKEHMVPLSKQAIAVLKELKDLHSHPTYVFPSRTNRDNHMSNNTILMALRRMGYGGQMTGHGFRSLALSTIKERLGYRHEVPDVQLAHAKRGDVNRAYDRATFLDERVKMMQEWADYLDKVEKGK